MAEEDKDLQDDGGIQVEVTPDPTEEKPRLKTGDTSSLDVKDDEISGYGKEVQSRIKKLRFAFHEERRMREQAQRDLATHTEFSQRLFRENGELKKNVQRGEQAVLQQALTRVDAEIQQAKAKSKAAYEAGASEDIVATNEQLARAVAEKDRLSMLVSPPGEEDKGAKAEPPPPAPPPGPDEPTRNWLSRNPWYNQPGEEERSGFALAVSNRLKAQGIDPARQPDLYWRTIDERLNAVYPEKRAETNGNGDRDRDTNGSRPLAVAGGTRSNAGAARDATRPRVIQLSESQVRVARKLGLTPEQYARQLVLEEGGAGGVVN